MRRLFIISAILLLTAAYFAACKKNTERPDPISFTIKGRLIKDCSGVPVSNEVLSILERDHATANNGPWKIGTDTTGSDGYFSIKCSSYGWGSTYYLRQSWADQDIGGIRIEVKKDTVVDIGTLYDNYTASAILQIRFAHPRTDTLFVATWDARDTFSVYPAMDTQYVRLIRDAVGKPSSYYFAYYGFGRAGLKRPAQGVGGVNINAENAFEICGNGDTTMIDIP